MGEVASKTICNAVCDYWSRPNNKDSVVKARRACRSASAKLDERSLGMNHVQMGPTLVTACIDGETITITHCGDSRCYLLRDGEVVYQTREHVSDSYGWEIISKRFFTYKPEAAVPDIAHLR